MDAVSEEDRKIAKEKMYRNLNEKEQKWLKRLMNVEFQGRDILLRQLSKAKIFLLHIVNGIINELEILTADSAQIDTDKIELERVEYEIKQEVIMKK